MSDITTASHDGLHWLGRLFGLLHVYLFFLFLLLFLLLMVHDELQNVLQVQILDDPKIVRGLFR